MNKLLSTKKWNLIITSAILLVAVIVTIITGITFRSFSKYETYFYVGENVEIQKLVEYSPNLKGTTGAETNIYVIKGPDAVGKDIKDCPSLLILGGTHPNEPSGQLTAAVFLENLKVSGDTVVFILTETNRSAFTHSHPQEASPLYYSLTTQTGAKRIFKFGSRATNTNEQWPNPDIYTHSSGQQLSNSETRNINRAYPGDINGSYTERVAYGVTQLIKENDIKVTIDLHEASPEYITINAMVYHQNAENLAGLAELEIKFQDISINSNPSPKDLHGLTHRELGDFTNTLVILCETSNAAQGKIRGPFTEELITYSEKDKFYEKAREITEARKKAGEGTPLLYGYPTSINERVARHTATILAIIQAYNYGATDPAYSYIFDKLGTERKQALIDMGGIDIDLDLDSMLTIEDEIEHGYKSQYELLMDLGVGYFLHDPE